MSANQANSTVMSSGSVSESLLSPPKFDATKDKLTWRKNVRYWAENVNACATGGDNRAKGTRSALAMTLFRSLSQSKQQAVEEAIEVGDISLDATEDFEGQLTAIEAIMATVAQDSITDSMNRMTNFSKAAMTCVRHPKEEVKKFIEIENLFINSLSCQLFFFWFFW